MPGTKAPARKRAVKKTPTKKPRPRKAATKKTAKATARATRKLSASHKQALADGRTMSATVDRYLTAVNTPKRRGRKVSSASLQARLTKAKETAKKEQGVGRVLALQEVRDLETKLIVMSVNGDGGTNIKPLEAEFIKVAKRFGENRGIGYGAWRDAGVAPTVLAKAGIARTRSS